MNDNKFWLGICTIGGVVAISVVLATVFYWVDHNAKIVTMVENGTSPMAAMCGLQDDYGSHPVCVILAGKEKEDK